MGDIAECKAIKKVFSNTSHIKMNSTKSLVGHCLGAAAGVEAITTIKAITTGWVHPTLNQYKLIDEVAGIDTVPNVKQQHKVGGRRGGQLQLGDEGREGVGGTVVFEKCLRIVWELCGGQGGDVSCEKYLHPHLPRLPQGTWVVPHASMPPACLLSSPACS